MSDPPLTKTGVSSDEKGVVPHQHDEKTPLEHDEKISAHTRDSEAVHGHEAVALNLVENPLKVSSAFAFSHDML